MPVTLPSPATARAIVVGLERYDGEGLSDQPLNGAVADALAFADALEHCGVSPKRIDLWLSPLKGNEPAGRAWREFSRDAFDKYLAGAPKKEAKEDLNANPGGSVLVLYWSGHGVVWGDEHRQFLLAPDAETDQPRCLEAENLRDVLLGTPYAAWTHQVIVIDACRRAMGDWGFGARPQVLRLAVAPPDPAGAPRQCQLLSGWLGQSSQQRTAGSRFTLALVEAMKSGPEGAWPDFEQVGLAAEVRVEQETHGQQRPQVIGWSTAELTSPLPDVITLEIRLQREGNDARFEFLADVAGEASDLFDSPRIELAHLKKWVALLYTQIGDAWLQRAGNGAVFHKRLKGLGAALFNKLVSPGLAKLLWRLHSQGKLNELLVRSDVSFIPWEIAWLDDPEHPGNEHACFLGQLGLCRWLYGAVPVLHIRIRPDRLGYVIPHYPDPRYRLAQAEMVDEPLLQRLNAHRIPPHRENVLDALSSSAYDLLHFACHAGSILDGVDYSGSVLLLEGEYREGDGVRRYVTDMLSVDDVDRFARLHAADGNRPLVFLNGYQVGGLGLAPASVGNFAYAFLGPRVGGGTAAGQAGAFVTPLWSMKDQPGGVFVQGFYEALLAPGGCTIGRAVRAARERARVAGDPSWLAHTVYAHPNCHVQFTT